MMVVMFLVAGVVFLAGALGGLIGYWLRHGQSLKGLHFMHFLVSGVAAVLAWALYGPQADFSWVGAHNFVPFLPLSAVAGAVMVGYLGENWWSTTAARNTTSS